MMTKTLLQSALFLLAVTICSVNSYRILGVIPMASRSHFILIDTLMRNLAKRGHNVTVISPYPPKQPIKNYRNIHTPVWSESAPPPIAWYNTSPIMYSFGLMVTNSTLSEPSVQKLLMSGEKFDLVVCEVFASEALFGLAEHFNAPLVGFSTAGAVHWTTDLVGSPSPTSYVPASFQTLSHKMTLLQRIWNQFVATYDYIYFNYFYLSKQNDIFEKYFPNSSLGLNTIRKSTALVLLTTHFSLAYPRPYMPNMIEVGGLHIEPERKPLPNNMQKFLNGAKDGAIYFSMGSNIKSSLLPLDKRTIFLETFRSLKQRVLWKFEDPNLPKRSENIFISDWFPQNDILAHPNVKLIIHHGGLLSTIESIYHQKPFIGIPMFGDHFMNVARAEDGGWAIMLDYESLSKETLLAAINKMLQDPSYTINAAGVSERYRDQPMEPLDWATYWVEYVARHKGARHLHSAGQELNFIQYHNLDAMMILYGGTVGVLFIGLYSVLKVVAGILRLPRTRIKIKRN